jgi:Putative Flp pilus-assembly TadE/G-like
MLTRKKGVESSNCEKCRFSGWSGQMKRRLSYGRGQIAVVFVLVMATLLGVISLCTDVGVLYYDSIQLQKSADAAALAGAGYFGPNIPPTPNCSWSAGSSSAQDAACDYVMKNGIAKRYIVNINSPALGVASVPFGAQSVQVQLKRTDVPVFFGRLLGLNNLVAIGNATAIGPMPIHTLTRGLFPIGVQYPATMSYNTTITLSEQSSGTFGPGNWGWLNMPQCNPVGSAAPPVAHNGGVQNLAQNVTYGSTCSYSVGGTINPETGATGNSKPASTALNNRIGNGDAPPLDPNQIDLSDSQLVIVPLVDWNAPHGQSTTVEIKGFAAFWLTSLTGQGAAIKVTGQFVKVVDSYGIGGSGTSWGAYSAPILVQ